MQRWIAMLDFALFEPKMQHLSTKISFFFLAADCRGSPKVTSGGRNRNWERRINFLLNHSKNSTSAPKNTPNPEDSLPDHRDSVGNSAFLVKFSIKWHLKPKKRTIWGWLSCSDRCCWWGRNKEGFDAIL